MNKSLNKGDLSGCNEDVTCIQEIIKHATKNFQVIDGVWSYQNDIFKRVYK